MRVIMTGISKGLPAMFLWILTLLTGLAGLTAQADIPTPLTPENLADFQPVQTFSLSDLAPENDRIETGWFTLSPDGAWLAAPTRGGALMLLNLNESTTSALVVAPGASGFAWTVLDARFSPDSSAVVALLTDGVETTILSAPVDDLESPVMIPVPTEVGAAVHVWFDSTQPDDYVWVEAIPNPFDPAIGAHQVARFSLTDSEAAPLRLPSAPENDMDAIVRIGRIPAPLAITSTQSGTVRLWDLESGNLRAEVALPAPAVFGRVTETDGNYLVWRDANSQALNLLDFVTGENRFIAELGGDYIQALLVTPDAEVILGVYRGDAPSVTAWLTADGAQVDLGVMWPECTRVPDMVQLSSEGSTLVIGCDAGFELWRVSEN
jgi:hypothetical protein